jgi:hypothetical protein
LKSIWFMLTFFSACSLTGSNRCQSAMVSSLDRVAIVDPSGLAH